MKSGEQLLKIDAVDFVQVFNPARTLRKLLSRMLERAQVECWNRNTYNFAQEAPNGRVRHELPLPGAEETLFTP